MKAAMQGTIVVAKTKKEIAKAQLALASSSGKEA